MNEQKLRAAFQRERLVFPGDPTPVVQLEVIDLDPVSARLLWLDGRGFDSRAIAEGQPEPRNPGPDNPLTWPASYVEKLERQLRERKRTASTARVLDGATAAPVELVAPNAMLIEAEDDATAAAIRATFEKSLKILRAQQARHRGKAAKRKQRTDFRLERSIFFMWRHGAGQTSKRKTWDGIASEWNDLTIDWEEALARKPNEWPDSLGSVPQALAAYEEWSALPVPKAENLTEWVVREAVVNTIRPRIAKGRGP